MGQEQQRRGSRVTYEAKLVQELIVRDPERSDQNPEGYEFSYVSSLRDGLRTSEVGVLAELDHGIGQSIRREMTANVRVRCLHLLFRRQRHRLAPGLLLRQSEGGARLHRSKGIRH